MQRSAFKLSAKNTQIFVREGEPKGNLEGARKFETTLCSATYALLLI